MPFALIPRFAFANAAAQKWPADRLRLESGTTKTAVGLSLALFAVSLAFECIRHRKSMGVRASEVVPGGERNKVRQIKHSQSAKMLGLNNLVGRSAKWHYCGVDVKPSGPVAPQCKLRDEGY